MRKLFIYFLPAVLCCAAVSCNSYKKIQYFQDLDTRRVLTERIENQSPMTIQSQDLLGVSVTSVNAESSAIFNNNLIKANGANYDTNLLNPVSGFLVDSKGFIQLPVIGAIEVAGLTVQEVQDRIRQKLTNIVEDPVVTVRLMNFRVSVLGDVQHPGVYPVVNERVSVTDALSMAGDLNITANRTVVLVREVAGERSFIPVDLTSKKLFASPYFYLRNNDLIFVQAGKNKVSQTDANFKTATLILSGLSIAAIVLSNIL